MTPLSVRGAGPPPLPPPRRTIRNAVFFASGASHSESFSGSRKIANVRRDWHVSVYGIDATWGGNRGAREKGANLQVQTPSPGMPGPSSGCPKGAPMQSFDYCVQCPSGLGGTNDYSYPGYPACSAAAAEVELKAQYGGCTVKTGSC